MIYPGALAIIENESVTRRSFMRLNLILPIFCIFITMNTSEALNPDKITVSLGERKTLLASGQLGLDYFPDEAVVVLSKEPVYRHAPGP